MRNEIKNERVCVLMVHVCACAAIRFNLINPRDDSMGLVIDKKREIKFFCVSFMCIHEIKNNHKEEKMNFSAYQLEEIGRKQKSDLYVIKSGTYSS